jgi:hypothetical protein
VCVGCLTDDDCENQNGSYCDKPTGSCVGCLSDADCPSVVIGGVGGICPMGQGACMKGKLVARRCHSQKCETKCATTGDCPRDTVCDPFRLTCVDCIADKDCKDSEYGHVCDLLTNQCQQCRVDADCGADDKACWNSFCYNHCHKDAHCTDPDYPFCNLDNGQCGSCRDNSDCTGPKSHYCIDKFECRDCLSDSDCPSPGFCDSGFCQATCVSNQGCKDPALPLCQGGQCLGCLVDADCSKISPARCDDSGTCQRCLTDFDCPESMACVLQGSALGCAPFSVVDPDGDFAEDADDVRAGASDLTPPDGKSTSLSASFCSFEGEIDWYSFQSQAGDSWSFVPVHGMPPILCHHGVMTRAV